MRSPQVSIVMRADDLGMHTSIDDGIFAAIRAGTINEVAWMAVGKSSASSAKRLRDVSISTTLHIAFASEWDLVKWPSLRGEIDGKDGFLPLSPSELADADLRVLLREALAQIEKAYELGVTPNSFNFHIDAPHPDLAAEITRETGLKCHDIGLGLRPSPAWFQSFLELTSIPENKKHAALIDYIESRTPGRHCVVTHPGLHRESLMTLCSTKMPGRHKWAVDYRLSDAELLGSCEVSQLIGSDA